MKSKKPEQQPSSQPDLGQQKGVSKRKAFLAAFRTTASVTKAAEAAGIDRQLHYRWLLEPAYQKAFESARAEAAQLLEDEAVRRAHEGVLQPVFYKGKPCGATREYSDQLLMFLLRALQPQRFRDNATVEHTGKDGGPIVTRRFEGTFEELLTLYRQTIKDPA
jgi:hypothetical protein